MSDASTPSSATPRTSGFGRNALVVTAGAMIANIAAYLVHLPASRWLGPELYGEFAALLSVQLIAAVPTLALQAVVARDRTLGASQEHLRRIGWKVAAGLAVAVAVLAWPVSAALSTSMVTAVAAMASAPALAVFSVELGLMQAAGRFVRFSVFSALAGIGKSVPAIAVLAATGHVAPTLAAEAAGVVAVFALARWTAGRAAPEAAHEGRPSAHPRVADVVRASQVQLALIALTTTDLLVARAVLDPVDAGNYALGSIATKVAFWLPAAVATVLFPQMADPASHARARRLALTVVGGVGLALCLGALAVTPVVPIVVGEDYAPVAGWLWLFTALGALQSVIQVLLLAGIAAHRTREAGVAWIGVALVAGAPLLAATGAAGSAVRDALSVTTLATWTGLSLVVTAVVAGLALRPATARSARP